MKKDILELEQEAAKATDKRIRLELLLELLSHHVNDDFVEGWRFGQDALGLATELDDRWSIAFANEGIAGCLWKLAEYSDAMEHYESALDGYLGLGNLYRVAKCYCGIGIIQGINEDYANALENFEEGLSACNRSGKMQLAASITGNIGHVYLKMGRYDDAQSCYEYGLNYNKKEGSLEGAGDMLMGMAGICVYTGEMVKGLELSRRALETYKRAKQDRGIAVGLMNIGEALYRMGKLQEAKTQLKSALNFSKSINLKMTEADVLRKLSEVCSDLDQTEESAEYLDRYMAMEQEEKREALRNRTSQFQRFQKARQASQENNQ